MRRLPMTQLVDGRAIAARIAGETAAAAAGLRAAGTVPGLAVLLPTDDPGAAWYVRAIERAATRAGVSCQVHRLAGPAGPAEITGRLAGLSADPAVHGIICQTPLPPGSTLAAVGQAIGVAKDVDGANPASLGRLAAGLPGAFPPATAAAVLEILRQEGVALRGRRAVVVGRSIVVGKPTALLLLAGDATVTICHSRTRDLAAVCREAEVLVGAAGRADRGGLCRARDGGDRRGHQPGARWWPGRRRGRRRGHWHRRPAHPGARRGRPGYHGHADPAHRAGCEGAGGGGPGRRP